ncbi:MAG: phytanoyl-CoA dioxygenase family protein [Pseudomonadota bacterium]
MKTHTADAEEAFLQRLRHEEYQHRLMELELAASGIPPVGLTPAAPTYGAKAFVADMADIDVDAATGVAQQIHEQGYAIVERFLSPAALTRLRDGMAPLFDATRALYRRDPATRNQTVHVQNMLAKSDIADEVVCMPQLRATLAALLGFDFIMNAGAVAMSPDPGCASQGLHRDDGFFALFPRPHMPLVITVAIALDDFTTANGATHVTPGSHLWRDDRAPQDHEVQQCEMPAGSVLFWDGAIWHGGGGNRTDAQTRRTLTLNYTRGWLRTQFNQYLSIPRERILAMPPALQADLGYHRSALGLGGCDVQDPLRYLQALQAAGGDGHQHMLGRESQGSEPGDDKRKR